ncbi:basic proline-rich protein-like [Serinus canaria]|uniref:basic proline-rich protein-like n=1 Tax=Serinus canaria TaxID=9135 RepID=UPI0021CC5D6D|nr:basic proline-rich protein-like [Serinus canaria]
MRVGGGASASGKTRTGKSRNRNRGTGTGKNRNRGTGTGTGKNRNRNRGTGTWKTGTGEREREPGKTGTGEREPGKPEPEPGNGNREKPEPEPGNGNLENRNRGAPGSPGMRRRRGGGAAPAEACGVWLDTAELKRGPARPLTPRAASRAAGRKQSPVLPPQPGSSIPRQSSILSFFSPRPDEGDKENKENKENRRPGPRQGSGAAPPAWPVKILPLPQLEEPPGAEQGLQGTAQAGQRAPEPLELSVEPQRQSRASPGAGGASWCWGRDKPWESPGGRGSGGGRAQPCSRAGAGDTKPGPGAAPRGVCCPPQSPGPAQPLRERGQVPEGPCRELQGCQGSRATAHGDRERASPPRATPSSPRATPSSPRVTPSPPRASPSPPRASPSPLRATPSPPRATPSPPRVTSSPPRASPSPPRVTPSPLRATPSPPRARQPPELGSEPLFTQDSEGNRVIKHW